MSVLLFITLMLLSFFIISILGLKLTVILVACLLMISMRADIKT